MSNQIEPMEDTFEVKEMDEIEEMDQPKPSKAKKIGGSVGGWLKRHKKPMIFVLVLVVVLGGLYFFIGRPYLMRKEMAENMNQNVAFIRTTTLQKTSLADSISATGLVASNNVSTVTTNLNASVKSVEVAVGDYVEEGDVIVTLDTEEINKQITRAQEKVQENIEKAQESYDSAYTNWQKAKESYEDYESQYSTASSEYKTARTEYNTALALVQDLIDEVEEANAALQDAQYDLASLLNERNDIQGDIDELDVTGADYDTHLNSLKSSLADIDTKIESAQTALEDAETAAKEASTELTEMENLTGYSTLYKTYTTAKSAYSSASDKLDSAEEAKDNARKNMLEAKEDLEEAQAGDSDDLEDLYDELENYTLRAETAGYITSLNATVGSRLADGTVAVIQDTDDLVITISIAEYDIDSVELGMKAIITSDSIEGEVSGTLTQIDPVASGGMSSSATFSAQVSVDGKDSGLIIGVNAAVDLIVSSTEDIFVVPYDAVGRNDAGQKIVYVKTSGSGVDATFEEIVVETGAETDYYIEIISSELTEGMEVRSSADLTEATYTQQEGEAAESGAFDMLMGGGNMGGGNMGGGMPSGGMPGGNMGGGMPSGGGMPGGR